MKLESVTVTNYRSITKAYRIGLSDLTVLVGPNNEGKSNLLKALVTAMEVLTSAMRVDILGETITTFRHAAVKYRWKTDFPISLQSADASGKSSFELEFSLSKAEIDEFWEEINSSLNGTLPIRIEFGSDDKPAVSVRKKGPGGAALTRKSGQIAYFVSQRIQFQYIPAVRTASSAQSVVDRMIAKELGLLESSDEYKSALNKIADLQKPVLAKISENVKATMIQFLPSIKDVTVEISTAERGEALRRTKVLVDDGTPTTLERKGDGVQSLAAIALMRYAATSGGSSKHLVVAIEEPESHLHSNAMHGLRGVLKEVAAKSQLVLTTHSALFVNRAQVSSNVIVNDNKAAPAQSIEKVRQILGIRASENLQSAELVLVVEGEDDRESVGALLKLDSTLASAIEEGSLALDTLGGGTNLPYKLSLLRTALCSYYCFLDDDPAGHKGFDDAAADALIDMSEVTFTTCQGKLEAEFEDLLDPMLYEQFVLNKYGISLKHPKFSSAKKWSVRMNEVFKGHGKPWNDKIKQELKAQIAQLVSHSPTTALNPHHRESFDALVTALKTELK
jgi:putative ATP-dependent endonuclease of the OLD family